MKTTEEGIALIKQYEGFEPHTYRCPAGKPTIGYGHVVRPRETFGALTEGEADALLRRDVAAVEKELNRTLLFEPNANQYSALVSFCFNLGTDAFRTSTLRALVNRKDWLAAAGEFERWVWATNPATGEKARLAGLVARRKAEKALFLKPVLASDNGFVGLPA